MWLYNHAYDWFAPENDFHIDALFYFMTVSEKKKYWKYSTP